MKPITLNTSYRAVLAILALGLVLGAAILFWKRAPDAASDEGRAHAEPAAAGHAAEPGADAGLVRLTAGQIRVAGIQTASAAAAVIWTTLQLPGEVRFDEDRTAHIVPRLPGVAEAVPAALGQAVRKGQVLAVIASAQLAELRSTLDAANTRLALARTTYEREKKLWEDRISAQQDYQQALQAYQEARIAADNARAKLAALGVAPRAGALNRYALRAPFDGVIVEKHISLGEAVKEDANVFLLTDLSRVWVDVAVTPKDLGAVRVGAAATVKAAGTDLSAAGKVSYVGALVGEQTRAASARIELASPGQAWRPGLFVDVALAQGSKEAAVTVRGEALHTVDDKPVVFVRVAQGFRAQPVVVGARDQAHVEILQGLAAGTPYAAAGSFVLKAELGKDSAAHAD